MTILYNNIPNITSENNCFYYGKDDKIEIHIGSYELESISDYLEKKLQERHSTVKKRDINDIEKKKLLNIFGNLQTLKVEIYSEFKIDFKKRTKHWQNFRFRRSFRTEKII